MTQLHDRIMRFVVYSSIIIVFSCCVFGDDHQEWENFKLKFEKRYGENEENFRKQLFLQNLHKIEEHNQNYEKGLVSFEMGINKFSDYSQKEMETFSHGILLPRTIPESFDWRDQGVISPVKDQGICGSCWAFAAIGAIEANLAIYSNLKVSLSEQNLVDCIPSLACVPFATSPDQWLPIAYQYIIDNGGVATSEFYPQQTLAGNCSYIPEFKGASIKGYVTLPMGDEEELKNAVATVGPVAVTIHTNWEWEVYTGGVFYSSNCHNEPERLTHAAVVVGYGNEDGEEFWLVKNSYGADFGLDGYIKMARNRGNNCGIATAASYPIV